MYSKIIIVGNLGKDPEMRYTPSGAAVTSFSVATSHQYTNSNGEQIKETAWFRVSSWGKQAESCNTYLHKGSRVMVEGRLTADPATGGPRIFDRSDGSKGASFEINAERVVFLSPAGEGSQDQQQAAAPGDEIPW